MLGLNRNWQNCKFGWVCYENTQDNSLLPFLNKLVIPWDLVNSKNLFSSIFIYLHFVLAVLYIMTSGHFVSVKLLSSSTLYYIFCNGCEIFFSCIPFVNILDLYHFIGQDFMSGKTVFRNLIGILLPGVNSIITERTSKIHGQLLEKAVQLALEIIIIVLEKDILVSDYWRPLYQVPIHFSLSPLSELVA